MTTHAEHGASVAARWMACPGSINLSRQVPWGLGGGGAYAQEGTAAHEVARRVLVENVDPLSFLDQTVEGVLVDEDMCEHVRTYTDYCKALREKAAQTWVEHQFSLEDIGLPWVATIYEPLSGTIIDMKVFETEAAATEWATVSAYEDQAFKVEQVAAFGTTDFGAYDPVAEELEIVDLKFGRGVVVEARGNKQGRYYALGSALALPKKYNIQKVKITIIQPRAGHRDGVIRSDELSFGELIEFAADLLSAIRATLNPHAELVPGPQCKFCPAAGICPKQYEYAQQTAMVVFDQPGPIDAPPAPEILPLDVFAELLPKLHTLEDWIAAMRKYQRQLVERGELPGYKLVEKRANRSWINEDAIATFLKKNQHLKDEEMYVMKLKSPAQIEKVIGKKMLPDGFTQKVSSGTNVVPIDDPRPAVAVTPGEVFDAITDGDE